MSGASLKGGLKMDMHRSSCSVTKILQLLMCANMVSTFLGLFIFTTSCSCISLPPDHQLPADKLQVIKGGFQQAHMQLSTQEVLEKGPKKLEKISKNQNLGDKRIMHQWRSREQQVRAQNTNIMGSLHYHKATMKPANPVIIHEEDHASSESSLNIVHHKVTIKPAQLIHRGIHSNGSAMNKVMYQEATPRQPAQVNGGQYVSNNDLEAIIKPTQLHEGRDNELHIHEATIEVSAQSNGLMQHHMEHTMSPAELVQPHEEFYSRGRALHVKLLERSQKAMLMTEMRAPKYQYSGEHDVHARDFHADYAEAHPHPPRNN